MFDEAEGQKVLDQMSERSREVFRRVVEAYLESGEPIGSRTLTRRLSERVSPATVRNVMQDLEYLGLLDHPHVSAGRVPTERGLRLFVDAFLEVEGPNEEDRARIDATVGRNEPAGEELLDRVGAALSQVTRSASLVLAPKHEAPIRHLEFVPLAPDRALVVLVFTDGHVENRLFSPPPGTPPSAMREAANFLNAVAEGRTLSELRAALEEEISRRLQEIDAAARPLVEAGAAVWDRDEEAPGRLIVRGRSNLVGEGASDEELERLRELLDDLERKREVVDFLTHAETAEGVRIFIGSENRLFSLSGSSVVVAPYADSDRRVIGAVGVIGPTRLNYGRIVPIVDYTAQLIGRMLSGQQ